MDEGLKLSVVLDPGHPIPALPVRRPLFSSRAFGARSSTYPHACLIRLNRSTDPTASLRLAVTGGGVPVDIERSICTDAVVIRSPTKLVVVIVLVFAGCAQPVKKQPYDVELASRIHTVLLVQGPNQQRFITIRNWFIPPGNLGAPFALAAVADTLISTERITAALDPKQTRLQDRFSELLRDGLVAQGYETRIVVLPEAGESDKLLTLLRQHGRADAALVVTLKGQVSWSVAPENSTLGPPAAAFSPLLLVTAKAIEIGSGTVLYEDCFAYGRADQQAGATYFPSNPQYGFASVGEVVADPARLREGWIVGMHMIANKILADLQRKPRDN
jgi:hypothetical protein